MVVSPHSLGEKTMDVFHHSLHWGTLQETIEDGHHLEHHLPQVGGMSNCHFFSPVGGSHQHLLDYSVIIMLLKLRIKGFPVSLDIICQNFHISMEAFLVHMCSSVHISSVCWFHLKGTPGTRAIEPAKPASVAIFAVTYLTCSLLFNPSVFG